MKANGIIEPYDVLADNALKQLVNQDYNVMDYEPGLIDINELDMHELTAMFL